jgi:Putative zinc-finger
MNCEQIQELLSRFHDGELGPADRAAIELHLASCVVCPGELATIAELSELARTAGAPEPPADLWSRIELQLPRSGRSRLMGMSRVFLTRREAVLAALVLIALASAWWASSARKHDRSGAVQETAQIEEDGPFVDQLLVGANAGEPVSLQEAARRVVFRVPASSQLPGGYQLNDCCLCRDGCCDLVQCRFLCGSDRVLLVLGSGDHPTRYGTRPVLETEVNGKPARVVQCECGLACSWQCQGTALTLIGPRDLSKLVQLVAYVSDRLENRPGP